LAGPVIHAEDLWVERTSRGRKPVVVLSGASLAAGPGELVLVLGRPGAGKTTLLEALAGLLPLTRGSVVVHRQEGGAVRPGEGSPPRALRESVGMLFQFPERQFVGRTAREDVLWGDRTPGREGRAAEELARTGLPEGLWDLPLARLSRGEKRRVALAGLLARAPRVLLLDEPTVGLDPGGQALVWEEISAYRERGGAIVFATHWADRPLAAADRVLCLEAGRQRFWGTPADLGGAAREDAALSGLLPFAWRLRLRLESAESLPARLAACRDAFLGALASLTVPPPPAQPPPAARSSES